MHWFSCLTLTTRCALFVHLRSPEPSPDAYLFAVHFYNGNRYDHQCTVMMKWPYCTIHDGDCSSCSFFALVNYSGPTRRLHICATTCAECHSRSWVVVYVRGVCPQHPAQASICAEVMYCSIRSLVAFVSQSVGSTNSFNCFWLYLNTFYQYDYVLLSTIYIRAFGGCIMAIWAVAFIEICSSDPTFLCSCSILMDITVL